LRARNVRRFSGDSPKFSRPSHRVPFFDNLPPCAGKHNSLGDFAEIIQKRVSAGCTFAGPAPRRVVCGALLRGKRACPAGQASCRGRRGIRVLELFRQRPDYSLRCRLLSRHRKRSISRMRKVSVSCLSIQSGNNDLGFVGGVYRRGI
jgi:hypothetical protein